jgi:hypothetical protein
MTVAISFTAGWCDRKTFDLLQKCIESTKQIPDREILLCTDVQSLPFESDAKIIYAPNETLGKKNNILFDAASNEVCLYIRDYMELMPNFIKGLDYFGYDWDMCMTMIINKDMTPYRDWCTWCNPKWGHEWIQSDKPWPNGIKRAGRPGLVDYDETDTSGHYISGAAFLAKKSFMNKVKFDESLSYGESEDCEFSDRARKLWNYKMNPYSAIKLQIQKDVILPSYRKKGIWEKYNEFHQTNYR